MKKNWYSMTEGMKAPLVLYLIALVLMGLGNTFISNNATVTTILAAFRFTGGFIKTLFPFFLVINILGKQHEDSVPVVGGVISYFVIHIVSIFVANQNFPRYFYYNISIPSLLLSPTFSRLPVKFGLAASIIAIFLVIWVYKASRQRFNYGLFTFIDNDSWFIFMTVLASIVMGIVMSWAFPYVVNFLNSIMNFVSQNNANPAALFIYGIMERILELFGVEDILHNNFWIGTLGGTWSDANGVTYAGDVSIWTVQFLSGNISNGIGKYITPYYIINLFGIPAIILTTYIHFSNKIERRKMLGLVIIGLLISILSGVQIPMELLLLTVSPLVLAGHIILSSTLYGIFSSLGIFIGYSYSGGLAFATPGTLYQLMRNATRLSGNTMETFLIVGGIYLVVSIILICLYYHVLALDFLEGRKKLMRRKEFIRALGGLDNIKVIDGSPLSISVALYDNSEIDADKLIDLGAYRVRELYFCYYIDFGPGSISLYRQIKHELKEYQKCLNYIGMK